MRLLLNLLWAIFGGGLISALEYTLAGILCCLTVVGIPFGVQCFKIARVALFPFGKDFGNPRSAFGVVLTFPFNLLWIVGAGMWIFVSHISMAIALTLSLVGIPFAYQHVKLAVVALAPFGVEVRELS